MNATFFAVARSWNVDHAHFIHRGVVLAGIEFLLVKELKRTPLGKVSVRNSWLLEASWKCMVKDLFDSVNSTILEVVLITGMWRIFISGWERMGCYFVIHIFEIFYPQTFIKIVGFVNDRMEHCGVISTRENPDRHINEIL